MNRRISSILLFLFLAVQVAGQGPAPAGAGDAVKEFQSRVKKYLELRRKLRQGAEKLPNKATPEQINAHRNRSATATAETRAAAKPGDLFFPAIAEHIRNVVRGDLRGRDGAHARQKAEEGNPKVEGSAEPVKLQINAAYPDSAPVSSVPPDLLRKLPELPEGVQYRFVGRDLILLDATAHVIIDYMRNVMP